MEMMSVKPTGWDDDSKILPGVNMLTILFIRGKCTIDKISDLFDVFEKVLTEINFKDSKSILQNSTEKIYNLWNHSILQIILNIHSMSHIKHTLCGILGNRCLI